MTTDKETHKKLKPHRALHHCGAFLYTHAFSNNIFKKEARALLTGEKGVAWQMVYLACAL